MTGSGVRYTMDGEEAFARMALLQKTTNSVPTLVQVARLAGVGLGTASRALNGQGYVKEATASRVLQVAEELGYQRNEVARSLKVKRSRVIGIVIPEIDGPFMVSCISGAQKVLRKNHYMPMIVFTGNDPKAEAEEIEYLIGRQIDGLLVIPSLSNAAHFQAKQLSRIPVVAFDQPILGGGFDSILIKNRKGASNAVEHLIAHGHKRIACIGVNRHLYSIQKRIEGYRDAIRKAGLKEIIEIVASNEEAVAAQVDAWLAEKEPPTAIFSLNELTSVGVVVALATRGIKVPERIAFIGFDDVQLGRFLDPPITAVVQPGFEIGMCVATRLLERMESEHVLPAKRILLDTELVVRGSCGCGPGHTKGC